MANKKVIIGGVLLLGVALAAEPIVASFMVQEQMRDITQELDNHPMFTVLESSYEKGLFGGEATTKMRLSDAPQGGEFTLKHAISTVPMFGLKNGNTATGLAHIRTTLVLNDPKDKDAMQKAFAGSEPVIDTLVSYSNDIKVYIHIPAVNVDEEVEYTDQMDMPAKKQTSIQFSGMDGDIDVSADGGKISGIVNIPSFVVKESHATQSLNKEFKMGNINSTFSATKISKHLYSSVGDLKVALIEITNAMMPVTLTNNNMTVRIIDKKDTFDYEIDGSIEKIASPAGMPLPINQIKSKFALRNLDIHAFEQYVETLETTANQGQQVEFESMLPQLMSIGDLFLQRNLVLEEVINVDAEQGKGNIDINADFKALEAGMSIQSMDPMMELLPRASADIKINLPKAMLAMTPLAPQIEQFVQVGYIKEDAGNYSSHAQFKDKKLTVNGIEVEIPLPGNQAENGGSMQAPTGQTAPTQ